MRVPMPDEGYVGIGNSQPVGGSEVDGPGYILPHDEEFDSTDEVRLMDP
jgi:hypothetical protein